MTSHGRKGKRIKTRKGISKTRTKKVSARHSNKTCALTDSQLHGVAHGSTNNQTRKLSRSKLRPSVPFGGVLSATARRVVMEEAALVKMGQKQLSDVELRRQPFVKQALDLISSRD